MSALCRGSLLGSVAACALLASAGAAVAGGLAVREQSTSSQGASFAGSAAGGDLSSSFWNPAAISVAPSGLTSESHVSVIIPDVEVTSESVAVLPGGPVPTGDSISMDRLALVGSSYYAWRLNREAVLGLGINSPFGLSREVDNDTWSGQYHLRSARLLTINVNPMLSYQLAPGFAIGVGAQIEYIDLSFKANPSSGFAPTQANSVLDGDDYGAGFTAGLLWQPIPGTTFGLGFRSSVAHTIEGQASMANDLLTVGGPLTVPFVPVGIEADIDTPEIVTLSLRQALSPTTRLLGTVEWTNWSRIDKINFVATSTGGAVALGPAGTRNPGDLVNVFDFHWDDGWFFSLGGEWDYSRQLTLRAGVAYEISPIRDADQRTVTISDSDRVWLSVGATYRYNERFTFDFAYSHVFFDDAPINTLTTTPASATTPVRQLIGDADQAGDIVSFSVKTKW
jgi:long-chain fatty acid transport protein